MLSNIFSELGNIVTNVVTLFGDLFSKVIELIYTDGSITPVGSLLLISMGVGLFFFVLGWVRNLIKVRGR